MYLESRADNANTTLLPAPYAVSPTGDFDGNDGKWSTFSINIGDSDGSGSGQNFRVLISTSSPVTLVPQQAGWCDKDCAARRGVEVYNSQQQLGYLDTSKSWSEHGQYNIPLPYWWSDTLKPNGTLGFENVGLGPSSPESPILTDQWVLEYTQDVFFMGSFGLAAGALDPGSGPRLPFLPNFAANNTPSKSYGYTAGAYYQNNGKGVVGDLVLGGFDQSRVGAQNVSIDMISATNNTLLVGVQSITYHPDRDVDSNDFSFTSGGSGFYAAIDSTLPYLWLPDDICEKFADKYQLTYDNDTNLYTVNASAHNHNAQQNSTLNFKIGKTNTNSNEFTNIEIPYAAFDLEASSPIFANTTKYFPLRKSPNGIFVLGRAFLQEAYVVVDYERNKFQVAQAVVSDPMPSPHLVPIFKTDYVPPQSSQTNKPSSGGGLSGGAIAGIVIGVLAGLALLALGAFFFWKKKKRAPKQKLDEKVSEIDTTQAGEQVKHRRVSELDSEPPNSPKPSLGTTYYGAKEPFPPINEMESPPAELYSPPPEGVAGFGTPSERNANDYFVAGTKMRRRGATRESSGNNTPGTPAAIAELPGDDGRYTVDGQHFDPVVSPLQTPATPAHHRGPSDTSLPSNIDEVILGNRPESKQELERRPSHVRGASDTTIQSDTTAVSQPTPEELENWATPSTEPRRPLSE